VARRVEVTCSCPVSARNDPSSKPWKPRDPPWADKRGTAHGSGALEYLFVRVCLYGRMDGRRRRRHWHCRCTQHMQLAAKCVECRQVAADERLSERARLAIVVAGNPVVLSSHFSLLTSLGVPLTHSSLW
jgi:hypothetical protein